MPGQTRTQHPADFLLKMQARQEGKGAAAVDVIASKTQPGETGVVPYGVGGGDGSR